MSTFTELPLSSALQQKLAAAQFITLTPIQERAIQPALEGKDVIGTAQTGTGKTLAFLIPVIEMLRKEPSTQATALVLLPTRELAMQVHEQYEQLRTKTMPKAALVIGGVSEKSQIQGLRAGSSLIIATPGRLQDLTDRRFADLRYIKMLVLDEADRMLDMGFLPAIRRILALLPKTRQTLCFSATLEQSVAGLVHEYMRDPVRVALGSVLKPAESVELKAYEVRPGEKLDVLRQLLYAEKGQTLIFTRTKRGAQRLAQELARDGFTATMIHGDRSQSQRNGALSGFQEGRFQVLVATDIASRGSALRRRRPRHQLRLAQDGGRLHPPRRTYRTRWIVRPRDHAGRRSRSRGTPQHRAHPEAAHRAHADGPLRRTTIEALGPEHAGVAHTHGAARRGFRLRA